MREKGLLLLFAVCGCRAAVVPPVAPAIQRAQPPAPAVYCITPSAERHRASFSLDDGRAVLTRAGLRVIDRGCKLTVASQVASPQLIGARRLPKRMGGGWLFFSVRTLYLAKTGFVGELQPLATTPAKILRVIVGPKQIVAFGAVGRWAYRLDGARQGWPSRRLEDHDPKRCPDAACYHQPTNKPAHHALREVAVEPVAMTDMLHRDGRFVALSEGGFGWVHHDGNWHAAGRRDRSGKLALRLSDWSTMLQSKRGRLLPAAIAKPTDALRAAVRGGLMLGKKKRALVLSGAQVLEVDLTSGNAKVRSTLPDVPQRCRLTRTTYDLLAVCLAKNAIRIYTDVGTKPRLERRFPGSRQVFVGAAGRLAITGGCGSKHDATAACVRAGKTYTTHALRLPPAATVVRWLPSWDGAKAIVRQRDTASLYETSVSARQLPAKPRPLVVSNKAVTAAGVAPSSWFSDDWFDDGHAWRGRLRVAKGQAVGRKGAVTIHIPRKGPMTLREGPLIVARSGRFAIGQLSGTMYQSVDGGLSWIPTKGPPRVGPYSFAAGACSEVGCDLGTWLRIGWRPSKAARRPNKLYWAPPGFMQRVWPSPTMTCRSTAVVTKLENGVRRDAVNPYREEDRANAYAHATYTHFTRGKATPWTLAWWLNIGSKTVRLGASARLPFDLSGKGVEHALAVDLRGSHPVRALEVLGGGILLTQPDRVWLMNDGIRVVTAVGTTIAAAAQRGKLVRLVRDDNRSFVVYRQAGKWQRDSAHIRGPGTLGIDHDGSVVVVRLPETPPVTTSNAFVVSATGVRVLAPWRSLKTADSVACKQSRGGTRLLVRADHRWLRIEHDGVSSAAKSLLMRVRWTPELVCAEAFEAQLSHDKHMVAIFTAVSANAAMVTVRGENVTRRETRCVLEAAP